MPRRPQRRAAPQSPGDAPGLFDDPAPWTVSQLTRQVAQRLEDLGRLRVEGEVTDLRPSSKGHLYFGLTDPWARLSCVIWGSQARRMRLLPKEGDQMIAHGRMDVYAPRGSYSLVVERLEPLGLGALLARLEALKEELGGLGWFERRRPLPPRPRCVGVVTSRDGAALRDVLRTRSLRWPGYPLRLAHTAVQGPGAAEEIAAALRALSASPGVDVLLLCRGGGSVEDLWAFNERPVAEAIRESPIPVVSGVGHETDTTLADLVADHRAHTPTDAAQTVIPDRRALAARLERAGRGLAASLEREVQGRGLRLAELGGRRVLRDAGWIVDDRARLLGALGQRARRALATRQRSGEARLASAHARLERRSPDAALERAARRLGSTADRLQRSSERRLEAAGHRVSLLARGLEAISPLAVLGRGYSVTHGASGEALTDAARVAVGDVIDTRLASGRLRSRVEDVEPGEVREA